MLEKEKFYECVQNMINKGRASEIVHLYADLEMDTPGYFSVSGKQKNNFGSCSYLGLENHPSIVKGSIDAISKYGSQFSSSRAYVSIALYSELEQLLKQMFNAFPVIAPTTSLAHIAALPAVVHKNDIVLVDHQVHSSVQTAVKLLKSENIHTQLIRHNSVSAIKEILESHKNASYKVWYLADGIYSMYGDAAPMAELYNLMDEYPNFYCYIDDAHGMSCYGKNGRGFALQNNELHSQMILAVSFAKSFACGGASLLFKDEHTAFKVRSCGGPMITSGPLQPANLGAAIASAKIHLSQELNTLQNKLYARIEYAELLIKKANLPLIKQNSSPIFFIGTGDADTSFEIVKRMYKSGHYLNVSAFPVVPMKNAGIRFTITNNLSFEQIEDMIHDLYTHYFDVILEYKIEFEKIYTVFKIEKNTTALEYFNEIKLSQETTLKVIVENSLENINETIWNTIFKNNNSYDYAGLLEIEKSFVNHPEPENNWVFDYILIKNSHDTIIAAAHTTTCLVKDDMLADENTSTILEKERIFNPFYLCTKTTILGNLISEGNHYYIHPKYKNNVEIVKLLVKTIGEIAEKHQANNILLRDLSEDDNLMINQSKKTDFIDAELPNNFSINLKSWSTPEEYFNQLGYKSRHHVKHSVLPILKKFTFSYDKSNLDAETIWQLYKNVQQKGKKLNTFTLPKSFFETMLHQENWEIITAYYNDEIAGCIFNYKNADQYNCMLIGLNYDYPAYRSLLYTSILRAKELTCNHVNLGFGADMEKIRLGAKATKKYALLQTSDTFNYESLAYLKLTNK